MHCGSDMLLAHSSTTFQYRSRRQQFKIGPSTVCSKRVQETVRPAFRCITLNSLFLLRYGMNTTSFVAAPPSGIQDCVAEIRKSTPRFGSVKSC